MPGLWELECRKWPGFNIHWLKLKYEKNSDNKRKKITNEDYFIQLEIFGKSWKGRAKDFLVKMRGGGVFHIGGGCL